jgi:sugar O-acyltransferase (sialic acid O-acetyltransferase NeuD family)
MAKNIDVVIWGAGDQGELVKFIFDCYPEVRVRAFLVEDPDHAGTDLLGVPVLHATQETLERLRKEGVTHGIASMGNNLLRQQRSEQLESLGFEIANAIHPSAYLPPDLKLGTGVFVDSMSNFSIGSVIGNNVLISITVTIGHHVTIEDNVWISAGAVICARSHLGKNVHIGPGAITVPKNYGHLHIGDGAHVGAGALVLEDVPPNTMVVGSPAKVIRYVGDLTGV